MRREMFAQQPFVYVAVLALLTFTQFWNFDYYPMVLNFPVYL